MPGPDGGASRGERVLRRSETSGASDNNPGTEAQPWKTIARAGTAKELRPGDTVLIKSGLYRETANITVSGEPGKPITFAAAPGARVVVKGSELIRGQWTRVTERKDEKEPYPNAYKNIWKIQLGDEYFPSIPNRAERFVTQVFLCDYMPLQMIGPDHSFDSDQLRIVGAGLADMIDGSFYFDRKQQSLYVKVGGHPEWYRMEIGVRNTAVSVSNAHDVVVRGLEMRHNLFGSVCGVGGCERVAVEDCKCCLGSMGGLSICSCKNCTARRCDLSYNGNSGLGLNTTEDCVIEDCTLLYNNYRCFNAGWHCGGMKNIPDNYRTIIRRCEAAYTYAGPGIWFDTHNPDVMIVDNVCHHNETAGIFLEINRGGGVIANNLVYANRGRGIEVAGSPNTWVLHNTVADNFCGIVLMPRGDIDPLKGDRVLEQPARAQLHRQRNPRRGLRPDRIHVSSLPGGQDQAAAGGGRQSQRLQRLRRQRLDADDEAQLEREFHLGRVAEAIPPGPPFATGGGPIRASRPGLQAAQRRGAGRRRAVAGRGDENLETEGPQARGCDLDPMARRFLRPPPATRAGRASAGPTSLPACGSSG